MSSFPTDEQAYEEKELEQAADDGMGENMVEGEEPVASRARLIVKRDGAETDEIFAFTPPATIGRFDPTVGPIDIDLANTPEGAYVSRKHARITQEEGVWKVTDLGSSNGTWKLGANDFERVEEAELSDGDEITLGNARFIFRIG